MDIVMVWYQNDWGLYGRRYEMLARAWAEKNSGDRLLVVEPPLNPWVWGKSLLAALLARDGALVRYWLARLSQILQPLTQENPRLFVLRPFLLWPHRGSGDSAWTLFSFGCAWSRVEDFLRRERWREPLLWAYPPHRFVRYAVERWRGGRVCVDLVDDNTTYEGMPESLKAEFRRAYERVLARASVVFSVSEALSRKFSTRERPVLRVPNAVPSISSSASSAAEEGNSSLDLSDLPASPLACYVGRIDERLDVDLLAEALRRRPELGIVFAGGMAPEFRAKWDASLGGFPRVRRLGTVPHQEIPALLRRVDVCLLPHRITPLTRSMDPLKLYVYLMAGKPVIATGVALEPALEGSVRRADTAEEFLKALADCLSGVPSRALPDLSPHTWRARVDEMEKHVRRVLSA